MVCVPMIHVHYVMKKVSEVSEDSLPGNTPFCKRAIEEFQKHIERNQETTQYRFHANS